MVTILRLKNFEPPGTPLVTVRKDGDSYSAEWHSDSYRQQLAATGIGFLDDEGEVQDLSPDRLDLIFKYAKKAYANTSSIVVRISEEQSN